MAKKINKLWIARDGIVVGNMLTCLYERKPIKNDQPCWFGIDKNKKSMQTFGLCLSEKPICKFGLKPGQLKRAELRVIG